MMRILITGAAGFVGSHLVNRFLKEGYRVIGIDNFLTGKKDNPIPFYNDPNFKFIEQCVISPLDISEPLDWIFHFASPASPPKYLQYPLQTLRVNSEGTYHLLELARKKQAGFFFASTSEIYGDPIEHPQSERYWGNVNPIGPRSVYDEAKRFGEALTISYHKYFDIPVRIIRIFNTYGPDMDPNDGRVISNFITQALKAEPITVYGDGKQTRSFQYIDDLIEGIFRVLNTDYPFPINLGNPNELTILEIANIIKELIPTSSKRIFSELPEDDPRQRKPDIDLAKKLLGWEPKISLREGLILTISYFKRQLFDLEIP